MPTLNEITQNCMVVEPPVNYVLSKKEGFHCTSNPIIVYAEYSYMAFSDMKCAAN